VTSMVPPPNKLPAGRQAIKKCSSFKASLASPTSPTLYHPDQVSTFATARVCHAHARNLSACDGDGLTARLASVTRNTTDLTTDVRSLRRTRPSAAARASRRAALAAHAVSRRQPPPGRTP
jgi:hypothetical protein